MWLVLKFLHRAVDLTLVPSAAIAYDLEVARVILTGYACEIWLLIPRASMQECMEVLIEIAKREGLELSMSFTSKIATNSKQNIRKAIMVLEACKAHKYPFDDKHTIPIGWEEAIV